MRIDSHHHFWHYEPTQYPWISESMAILRQDYSPSHLKPLCKAAGVTGVITVQARQSLSETAWLLEIAAEEQLIRGVVGWIDLASSNVADQLDQFCQHKALKGVRHVVQDEPDDNFILGAEFNSGVGLLKNYGLVYDILIFAKQLQPTIRFVDQHPDQPFVLDHIAKPTIAAEFDATWAQHIRSLASRPNVIGCKFSGIVTEVRATNWDVETLRPYWDVALEAFGAERMMFGSDWPVCLLKSQYQQWVIAVEQLASELSADQQREFWAGNATRVYKLDDSSTS
jgi:L-fuconolactonase